MWMPSADHVVSIHLELAKIFQAEEDPISPCGVKSENMLQSACARPHVGIGQEYKYKGLEEKLAALFHSLTKNHPFHNGNKRTALVTMLLALYRNDRKFNTEINDDKIYDFVVSVTADTYPESDHGLDVDGVVACIARWIKEHTQSIRVDPRPMSPKEFAGKCEQAGANVREDGSRYKISNNNGKSVKFKKTSRKFPAPVLKNYLKKLGLNESMSGIDYLEFDHGVTTERDQMYRYMVALRRLAKT